MNSKRFLESYEAIKPDLVRSICRHEGWRPTPYTDTMGYETIGYGTKLPLDTGELQLIGQHLQPTLLSQDQGRILLEQRLYHLYKYNAGKFEFDVTREHQNVQIALADMSYNLGKKLLGFRKMLAAIKSQDYVAARREALDSTWARQVKYRAQHIATLLNTPAWVGVDKSRIYDPYTGTSTKKEV